MAKLSIKILTGEMLEYLAAKEINLIQDICSPRLCSEQQQYTYFVSKREPFSNDIIIEMIPEYSMIIDFNKARSDGHQYLVICDNRAPKSGAHPYQTRVQASGNTFRSAVFRAILAAHHGNMVEIPDFLMELSI